MSECVGRVEWGAQLGLRQCEGVENSRVCVCVHVAAAAVNDADMVERFSS